MNHSRQFCNTLYFLPGGKCPPTKPNITTKYPFHGGEDAILTLLETETFAVEQRAVFSKIAGVLTQESSGTLSQVCG